MKNVLMLIQVLFLVHTLLAVQTDPHRQGKVVYASDFVSSSGGRVEENTDEVGKKQLAGLSKDDHFVYDIEVDEEGRYEMSYRVAANQNGFIKVSLVKKNGELVELERISLVKTGGWRNWKTYHGRLIDLSKGKSQIRIDVLAPGFVFSSFRLDKFTSHTVPGQIRALNYTENQGGGPRRTNEEFGGQKLARIESGSYFVYPVTVTENRNYKFEFRTSTAAEMVGKIRVSASEDGKKYAELTQEDVPSSGGQAKYITTQGKEVLLTKKTKFLKIEVVEGGFTIPWFRLQ